MVKTDEGYLRKCLEAVMAATDLRAQILSGEVQKGGRPRAAKTRLKSEAVFPPRGGKVIVKAEGKRHAELFKEVKASVDISQMGVSVGRVGKTARGDLLIEVRGGMEKANILKAAMAGSSQSTTRMEVAKELTTIQIAGIEPDVRTEDVTRAIQDLAGGKDWGDIKVSPLRQGPRRSSNATVVLHRSLARKIVGEGFIRIGWSHCKVRNRVNIVTCLRCLEFGHRTAECKGEDRSTLCVNCGGPGPTAKTCENARFCISCKLLGHRTDQMSCTIFRRLANQKSQELGGQGKDKRVLGGRLN